MRGGEVDGGDGSVGHVGAMLAVGMTAYGFRGAISMRRGGDGAGLERRGGKRCDRRGGELRGERFVHRREGVERVNRWTCFAPA